MLAQSMARELGPEVGTSQRLRMDEWAMKQKLYYSGKVGECVTSQVEWSRHAVFSMNHQQLHSCDGEDLLQHCSVLSKVQQCIYAKPTFMHTH